MWGYMGVSGEERIGMSFMRWGRNEEILKEVRVVSVQRKDEVFLIGM